MRERREREAELMRAWRERNRERVRESNLAWKAANPDRARELNRLSMHRQHLRKKREAAKRERRKVYARGWYERNRERVLEQQRVARARRKAENPERYRAMANARQQRWRDSHRDEQNQRLRDHRLDNPASRIGTERRYYEKNREQILERARARYAANPEEARARAKQYRSRERRRRQLGLPPPRRHVVRPRERDENQRNADDFFARSYTRQEVNDAATALATPPDLLAAWKRDCARARAAYRLVTDPEVAEYKSESRRRVEAARELLRRRQAAEEARMDAIARDVNDRLRRVPRRPTPADPTLPHSPPGTAGPQLHI